MQQPRNKAAPMPSLSLPEELKAIFRFIHIFETVENGPTTCAAINRMEQYPNARDFIEATFIITPRRKVRLLPLYHSPHYLINVQVPAEGTHPPIDVNAPTDAPPTSAQVSVNHPHPPIDTQKLTEYQAAEENDAEDFQEPVKIQVRCHAKSGVRNPLLTHHNYA